MSPHVLTMIVMLANGDIVETRIGTLANQPLCDLAGFGVAKVLVEDDPALTVGWTCNPEGVSA